MCKKHELEVSHKRFKYAWKPLKYPVFFIQPFPERISRRPLNLVLGGGREIRNGHAGSSRMRGEMDTLTTLIGKVYVWVEKKNIATSGAGGHAVGGALSSWAA